MVLENSSGEILEVAGHLSLEPFLLDLGYSSLVQGL